MSRSAWQSVLIITGYPYIIPENLSREYFSAANSSRNSLYFPSDAEVRLDANAIGCTHVTFFPPGKVVVICCANTPAKASMHPSVVRINGVPL